MNKIKEKNLREERRARRTRAKIFGTAERPRLSVFRSASYIYAQVIDDSKGHTIIAGSTRGMKGTKTEGSAALGEMIAKSAKEKGIDAMVFDRGAYQYHGRVKSVAEAVRAAGIKI